MDKRRIVDQIRVVVHPEAENHIVFVRRVLQLDNLVCRGSRRTHRWIDQHRVDPLQLGVGLARACRQSLLRLIHIQVAPANLRGSRVVLRDEDDNHLARPT